MHTALAASPAPARSLQALRPLLRAARDGLRHLPDRLLHARRRAAALDALRRGGRPASVLFVCEGNIYRSPFAAAVLRALLATVPAPPVRVASVGFVGPGRPSPEDAREAALRCGVDLAPHRSALVSAETVSGAGLVVVMEPRQREALHGRWGVPDGRLLVLGDLDPLPIRARAVTDPWGRGPDALEESYARVRRCVAELARALPQE